MKTDRDALASGSFCTRQVTAARKANLTSKMAGTPPRHRAPALNSAGKNCE